MISQKIQGFLIGGSASSWCVLIYKHFPQNLAPLSIIAVMGTVISAIWLVTEAIDGN